MLAAGHPMNHTTRIYDIANQPKHLVPCTRDKASTASPTLHTRLPTTPFFSSSFLFFAAVA